MEQCSLQYRTGSLKAGSIPNQVGFANATKHRQGDFHGHTHIHTNIHTIAGPNTHRSHTHTCLHARSQTNTHTDHMACPLAVPNVCVPIFWQMRDFWLVLLPIPPRVPPPPYLFHSIKPTPTLALSCTNILIECSCPVHIQVLAMIDEGRK